LFGGELSVGVHGRVFIHCIDRHGKWRPFRF
jgi:hypothetical protein